MEGTLPYMMLMLGLTAIIAPAITQAAKTWLWVERWATIVNGVLAVALAVVCWSVFGEDRTTASLALLITAALGGGKLGAMGYTVGHRVNKERHRRQTVREDVERALRHRRHGLVVAILLLVPAAAAAQQPLAQGMRAWWCSDRLCNPQMSLVSTEVDPSRDPWADGVFDQRVARCGDGRCEVPETQQTCAVDCPADVVPALSDLHLWRLRYDYPWPDWWGLGNVCGQHGGECAAIKTAWEAVVTGVPWVGGGSACAQPGPRGRQLCDAVMTAGATLGCQAVICGPRSLIVSCPPHDVRTCGSAGGGGSADGYHRGPLSTLPPEHRPPNLRGAPKALNSTPPAGACAWVSAHARLTPPKPPDLYVVNRPECFDLPANCQTVASLRAQCWAAPTPGPVCGDGSCEPPEGPGSCPADCPVEPPGPAPALEILDCDPSGWRVRTSAGLGRVALGAVVTVEGGAVSLPAACAGECPEAGVLAAWRAVPGACSSAGDRDHE